MHMADALISPAVGAVGWIATAGLVAHCARRLRRADDDRLVPLMGTMGAFVFAAQMVNFPIPGTGSSGHLGGGLLLALVLGPHAAFIAMVSVLGLQALLFADGGLLALGCNVINMAFLPCFVGYPLVQALLGPRREPRRLFWATLAGALVAVELGALSVALQTTASGITLLPLDTFALVLLPIHLPIAIVEGLATAAVVTFLRRARPEALFEPTVAVRSSREASRRLALGVGVATAITAIALSALASSAPDGLEWSIAKLTGQRELDTPAGRIHGALDSVQRRTALLPDYALPVSTPEGAKAEDADHAEATSHAGQEATSQQGGVAQTSASGLLGSGVTLGIVALAGLGLRRRPKATGRGEPRS